MKLFQGMFLGFVAFASFASAEVSRNWECPCTASCTWQNGQSDACRKDLQDAVDSCLSAVSGECQTALGTFTSNPLPEVVTGGEQTRTAVLSTACGCKF